MVKYIALWLALAAQACMGQVYPSTGPIRLALEAARHERIAVIGIGDSNQLFGGDGWDEGWSYALEQRYATYATPLMSLGENAGNGAGVGRGCAMFGTISSGAFAYAGACDQLNAIMPAEADCRPSSYFLVPSGASIPENVNHGLVMSWWSAVGVNAHLRLHYTFGRFGMGPSLAPCARLQQPPYSVIVSDTIPATPCGTGVVSDGWLDVPAGSRNTDLNFRLNLPGTKLNGGLVGYYMQVENVDAAAGAVFHTLYGYGGQSARDMAESMSRANLVEYLGEISTLLGPSRVVVVRISTGLNDRNESAPSFASGIIPGNSPAAFADNIASIITSFRAAWAALGNVQTNLRFVVAVSHPISSPDDPLLVSYRGAANDLARRRSGCVAVDFTKLTSSAEMLANGWYNLGGTDRNHILVAGSRELARRELAALVAKPPVFRILNEQIDCNLDGVFDARDVVLAIE